MPNYPGCCDGPKEFPPPPPPLPDQDGDGIPDVLDPGPLDPSNPYGPPDEECEEPEEEGEDPGGPPPAGSPVD